MKINIKIKILPKHVDIFKSICDRIKYQFCSSQIKINNVKRQIIIPIYIV